MFSVDGVLNLLRNYSEFALIISLAISIAIAISGVIPSVFVTGANILFFGPVTGFFISLAGEVIGGWITFRLYRKGFKKGFNNLTEKYPLLEKIAKSKGNEGAFLILQGRIIPFIPSGFVTLAAALGEIDDLRFNIATFIGKIPSILLEVLISYGVISQGQKGIEILLTIFGVYFIYRTIRKRKI
ncbi:MAG: TVP38/TMEM64 family protein [Clostridium sp.]|uniref:TVP38/TMEM64 family protein n=1 Tax=Clostridium sp. TaxID=1506 RepID=UPI003F3A7181